VRRAAQNRMLAVASVALAAVTGLVTTGVPAAVARSSPDAQTRTIAFGVVTKHAPGDTAGGEASLTALEGKLGRTAAFTRDYLLWDSAFPTAYENWLGKRGTVVMVSVKSKLTNGTVVPWSQVAAAQPGSSLYAQIVSWADRLRDYGYPVYFTYNHEPEAAANNGYGTAADYIAAWRHIHDIFVAQGATNVRFMWIMTDWAFRVASGDARYAWKWYPGDAYVDGIAADAYNWSNCRYSNGAWQSLATAISGFMKFGAQHPSIPMWLTEFGSVENHSDSSAKANWLAAAATMLQQPAYAQIAGVAYFDESQSSFPNCDWPVESSSAATAALAAMGTSPYFQGSAAFTPSNTPPPSGMTFVAAASTTGNAATETVRVPAGTTAGDGLLLVATSGSPTVPTAPAGWTAVATKKSTTMASAVWERDATAGDAGTSVPIGFGGITKGSVALLAYDGTAATPVASAAGTAVDKSMASLATPGAGSVPSGGLAVSYWSVRTSVDTTLTPAGSVTERSAQPGSGGGRITFAAADGTGAGAVNAAVSPSAAHGIAWTVVLAPAS
jgi:hypothetical protein